MRPSYLPLIGLLFGLAACGGGNTTEPADASVVDTPDTGVLICPAQKGPTGHAAGTLSGDLIWKAEDSPHIVDGDLHIAGKLTIEPCAVVEITPAKSIFVDQGGALESLGTADKPITFGATDPTKPWASLNIAGTAKLANTFVKLGGKGAPMVIVSGAGTALSVDAVTLSESFNFGLELRDTAVFATGSKGLTIKDCGDGIYKHPLVVNPMALSTIPDVTFKGNRTNAIKIKTGAGYSVTGDQTVRSRGVPYDVGGAGDSGALIIASGNTSAPATLTIEQGITLRFAKDAKVLVEDPGADPTAVKNATGILAASGTKEKPIVFTSAEDPKLNGDWGGLIFGGKPNVNNRLDFVTVAYAGGATATFSQAGCNLVGGTLRGDAAVVFPFEPPQAFLKNSAIQHSAAHGIQRAWSGSGMTFLDAGLANTFFDIAGCEETTPKQLDGTCPADPPCPKP